VIVRIATEGQYQVPDDLVDELNRLDNETVGAVDSADEARFAAAYGDLLDLVRSRGTRLGEEDLQESELILPPPDLTLAEAEHEFTGDGLLPD
jgi:PspAA-like protein